MIYQVLLQLQHFDVIKAEKTFSHTFYLALIKVLEVWKAAQLL